MRRTNTGWRHESARHGLAAMGVKTVSLERYAGRWYNPLFIPTSFQPKSCRSVFADYTIVGTNDVRVRNTCGSRSVEGKARSVSRDNKRLQVSFFPFIWSDYVIEHVDAGYDYAIVGSPDKEYLWFLSRTPTMPKQKREEYKRIAASKGYDVSKLHQVKA